MSSTAKTVEFLGLTRKTFTRYDLPMSANENPRPAATVTLHHATGTVSEYEFRSVKMATSFAVKAAERVSVEKVIVVTALGALTLSHTTR